MNLDKLRHLIDVTHAHGIELEKRIAELTRQKKWLETLNKRRRAELAELEGGALTFTMYDSIEVSQIPANAVAVAGYVNGRWPTFREVITRWPRAKRLSIDVNGSESSADCLDVETGDALPSQAPGWYFRHKLRRPQSRPCFYANRSTMPAVEAALTHAGIHRSSYRLWVADYTYKPHIPVGFDACQWTDKADGKNLDQSLCFRSFL